MAVQIIMPRFGWTMEEGLLAEWTKRDGDTVAEGEVLFTVESDKALNEVESFDSGVLRIPPDSPPPGTMVKVGALLAYIVKPGEAAPFEAGGAKTASAAPPESAPAATAKPAKAQAPSTERAISPRARRVAGELGVDFSALTGSGRTGRIIERDVRAAAQAGARPPAPAEVRASPLARRAAAELGVDLAQLAAANPGRRIEKADVEAAAQGTTKPTPAAEPAVTTAPLSPVRRVIAERMLAGAHTTAPVTLTTEADATELVRLRTQLKNDPASAAQPVPSYNDLLAKLTAHALREHPALNARLEEAGLVQSAAVHIGIAVDTERGLLVPVLRDVQTKGLRQIAQEAAALIERARAGRLSGEEMRGSTFSLTNLGMYDIDAFTPIINLPECAILGVGRITPKLVVVDAAAERTAVRQMVTLSLTFDHRLVDGAPAARGLQRIKQLIEQPYLWLVA